MYNIIYRDKQGRLTTQIAINAWSSNDILRIQYIYASLGYDIRGKTLRFQTKNEAEAEEIIQKLFMLKEADLTDLILINDD